MKPRIATGVVTALLCLAGIPWVACNELLPQRSPGEKLYRDRCANCHGYDARGNTARYLSDATADLTDDNWVHGQGDDSMNMVVQYGVLGRMPDNEDLTREQREQIVAYLNTLIEKARSFN